MRMAVYKANVSHTHTHTHTHTHIYTHTNTHMSGQCIAILITNSHGTVVQDGRFDVYISNRRGHIQGNEETFEAGV